LHPFPPKDSQRLVLPAPYGAYIESSAKKIATIDNGGQDVCRSMVTTGGPDDLKTLLAGKKSDIIVEFNDTRFLNGTVEHILIVGAGAAPGIELLQGIGMTSTDIFDTKRTAGPVKAVFETEMTGPLLTKHCKAVLPCQSMQAVIGTECIKTMFLTMGVDQLQQGATVESVPPRRHRHATQTKRQQYAPQHTSP
jgi:hypothetical protein